MAKASSERARTAASDTPSTYLTPGEVAKRFGVTPKTVSNWCDRGLLEYVETPTGHRRILAASIKGGPAYDERLNAFKKRMAGKRAGSPPPTGDEIAARLHASRRAGQDTEEIDAATAFARLDADRPHARRQRRRT